jgi:N-hydroxyarylamine O-acetyltransferase
VSAEASPFPLDQYAERIDLEGPLRATPDGVTAMHVAHALNVPFENLDVHLRRPIRLDAASLVDKLVQHRRGGYCYETNGLLALALKQLGTRVQHLAARNLMRPWEQRQRTHLALLVEVSGRQFLCDVGFGQFCPLAPVPFELGVAQEQFGETYRIDATEFGHQLSLRQNDEWMPLYAFSLEPCPPIDFEIMNYFNSTHPSSPFVQQIMISRPLQGMRRGLRGASLTLREAGQVHTRDIATPTEFSKLLREEFAIALDDATLQKLYPGVP